MRERGEKKGLDRVGLELCLSCYDNPLPNTSGPVLRRLGALAQALCARYVGNRAKGRRSMKSDTLEAHVYRMNFRVGASKNMHYYSHGGHFV